MDMIWKRRNALFFATTQDCKVIWMKNIWVAIAEFRGIRRAEWSDLAGVTRVPRLRWFKPNPGNTKFNVDTAFAPTKGAAVGVIARTGRGEVKWIWRCQIRASSELEAEMQAILFAVILAEFLHVRRGFWRGITWTARFVLLSLSLIRLLSFRRSLSIWILVGWVGKLALWYKGSVNGLYNLVIMDFVISEVPLPVRDKILAEAACEWSLRLLSPLHRFP